MTPASYVSTEWGSSLGIVQVGGAMAIQVTISQSNRKLHQSCGRMGIVAYANRLSYHYVRPGSFAGTQSWKGMVLQIL